MTNAYLFTVIIMIIKCPLASQKVLKASLITGVSELLRHPQPLPGPLTTWELWVPFGRTVFHWVHQTRSPFSRFPLIFVSKGLLINSLSEGRRK